MKGKIRIKAFQSFLKKVTGQAREVRQQLSNVQFLSCFSHNIAGYQKEVKQLKDPSNERPVFQSFPSG